MTARTPVTLLRAGVLGVRQAGVSATSALPPAMHGPRCDCSNISRLAWHPSAVATLTCHSFCPLTKECLRNLGLQPACAQAALARMQGINVKMISQGASKTNISLIVASDRASAAVQSLHAAFFGVTDTCAASTAALDKGAERAARRAPINTEAAAAS